MEKFGRRRYFVVGSVIVEIVQPILRSKLQNEYSARGFAALQDFLNSQPVLHTLYHLRHKQIKCCTDSANCKSRRTLPLNYYQWDLLYAENPGPGIHYCHCKYAARSILLDDIDITLSSLILLNCLRLSSNDIRSIEALRILKNNYLSHNTKGSIKEQEYITIWADLTKHVLQLDSTKQDDLLRIQQRPLDPDLCHKHNAELLGMHQKLDEIGSSIDGFKDKITNVDANVVEIKTYMKELVIDVRNIHRVLKKSDVKHTDTAPETVNQRRRKPTRTRTYKADHYSLGHDIFNYRYQIDLSEKIGDNLITDMVMMDDDRLVMCMPCQWMLLIVDVNGSQVTSLNVQSKPFDVTAINSHSVAVTLRNLDCINLYDISNKVCLKSFTIPGIGLVPGIGLSLWCLSSSATVDNKLVINGDHELLIIDHQKEKLVRKIHTDCYPGMLHAAGGIIYFIDIKINDNNLYCYNITGDKLFTTSLPSHPCSITSLQDGSRYVVCCNGSVQHVSSDGRKYKRVKTQGLNCNEGNKIIFNQKQNTLYLLSNSQTLKVYHEK